MSIYSGFSFVASIVRVLYNRGYNLYTNGFGHYNPSVTYNVKRMEDKKLTQSIYEHTTAPLSDMTQIDDHLFLGNAYNAANYSILESNKIEVIVNITDDIFNYFENEPNIQYYSLSIQDINEQRFQNILINF